MSVLVVQLDVQDIKLEHRENAIYILSCFLPSEYRLSYHALNFSLLQANLNNELRIHSKQKTGQGFTKL